MFFAVIRVIQFLILPPSGFLILMAAGFLIIRKNRSVGRLCIAVGFILLTCMSLPSVSDYLITPLEQSHPPLVHSNKADVQAIVVLTGGVRNLAWAGLESEPSELSYERLVKGALWYRTLRVPVIIAGGNGLPIPAVMTEADAVAHAASGLGIPRKDIIIENRSRNTLESAKAVRDLVKHDRVLLVTSAYHMKRSAALFKNQGFEVIPAPMGYRSEHKPFSVFSCIPNAGNLLTSSLAVSEHLSLFWFRLKGDL